MKGKETRLFGSTEPDHVSPETWRTNNETKGRQESFAQALSTERDSKTSH